MNQPAHTHWPRSKPWLRPSGPVAAFTAALAILLSGCQSSVKQSTPIPAYTSSGRAEAPAWSERRFNGPSAPPGRYPSPSSSPNSLASFEGQANSPSPAPDLPGSRPSLDEELWIITRSPRREHRPAATPLEETPGFGALMTKVEEREVALPLKHTEVRANLSAYLASVRVTQQFHNPYDSRIEAVYVFPLPENAAVNEFVMTIGDRHIRGLIREREEAEQIYREAKRQGYVASLLTQERPNVFTQSVANLEPGREIDISIRYFHTLAYADGWYEFVFPMVVGPRFNPPGSTKGIGAVARGRGGISGQATEVQYLAPGEHAASDVSIQVDVHAPIEEHACRSHEVRVEIAGPDHQRFTPAQGAVVPDRDFVLRYRVAGEQIKSQFLAHRDERGGFFTMLLVPPRNLDRLVRGPLELVFVLDCSGSMNGRPIQQAKAAIEHALRQLEPDDTFQLINFSEHASQLGGAPLPATPANLQRGLRYLRSLNGEGGTMMIEGIKAALNFPHDPRRLRFVTFLTDGYIGNEPEILHEVHDRLGETRIFSFGVGEAPNRYLLDAMAKVGRGAVTYLGLQEDAKAVMDAFFDRIAHPALADVKVHWGGAEVSDVFPSRTPDLFVGRPVILTGRFRGSGRQAIRITGRAGGERFELPLTVDLDDGSPDDAALPSIWARRKIAQLYDEQPWSGKPFAARAVKNLALDFNLMSAFTAFVAVDGTGRTAGRSGTTVPVAVPVPDGVKYDTTVER